MRPQGLQVGGENRVGAKNRLDAHRGCDVGVLRQQRQVVAREQQHAQHAVGAVDQRETLFGAEHHGFDAGGE